jgi:hypothetical protein
LASGRTLNDEALNSKVSFLMVTGGASDCITTSFKELTFSSSLMDPKSLSAFKFSIFSE